MSIRKLLPLLAAAPLIGLAVIGSPVSASPVHTSSVQIPADPTQAICANNGAGLCLQNNGSLGSLIANDTANGTTTQQYEKIYVDGTSHGAPSSGGFPFNSAALNNAVAPGRPVYEFISVKSGYAYCADVNRNEADVNSCTGSQSYWVATGSGRLVSVGLSNVDGLLVFLKTDGFSSGDPEFVGNPYQTCPGACWGGF
jgi:hypothetical protein